MTVLVTGGAGYIGSHTAVALHEAGRQVVLLDNLRNASIEAVDAVRALTTDEMVFVEGDLLDADFSVLKELDEERRRREETSLDVVRDDLDVHRPGRKVNPLVLPEIINFVMRILLVGEVYAEAAIPVFDLSSILA